MSAHRGRKAAWLLLALTLAGWGRVAGSGRGSDPQEPPPQLADGSGVGDRGRRPSSLVFRGASDTSAAVAAGERTVIVADDENNVLRVYGVEGGAPVSRFDLTDFLGVVAKSPEADIEGAARIGNRVYWISSHGRNRDGKWRPNRCRFFATETITGTRSVAVGAIGRPCTDLAQRLADDRVITAACPGLAESFRPGRLDGKTKDFAPKKHGLNIEGLCADASGSRLFIGLRNPLVAPSGGGNHCAIIVPLLNPAEVIEQGQQPRFGRPMLWDLGGLGVRDMTRSEYHRATFILAGPHGGGGRWALYRWSGDDGEQPVLVRPLDRLMPGWHPEALVAFSGSPRLLLLSDDGTLVVPVGGPWACLDAQCYRRDGTSLNKHLRDERRKSFRGQWLTP